MGDTIWVDVQGRAKNDLPSDNSIMLRLEKELERLSDKLGVARLTQFYDYSLIERQFAEIAAQTEGNGIDDWDEDDGEEDQEEDDERGMWFEPARALAAVTAIRKHLARHPSDLGFEPDASTNHWLDHLMDELDECRRVLRVAVSKGKKFRFLIVP